MLKAKKNEKVCKMNKSTQKHSKVCKNTLKSEITQKYAKECKCVQMYVNGHKIV
jgi:hypothetical protein